MYTIRARRDSMARGRPREVLKATWFADPDSRWWSETGNAAWYDISLAVTVEGVSCKCDPIPWMVEVNRGGKVEPWPIWGSNSNQVIDSIEVTLQPHGLWYVTGPGLFQRHQLTPVIEGDPPATSDFYNKVLWHENWHVHQFANLGPWSAMWDVDWFYENVLSQLPGETTEQLMRDKLEQEVMAWHVQQDAWYLQWRCEMEKQAVEAEYIVNPRYLEVHWLEVPDWYGCSY